MIHAAGTQSLGKVDRIGIYARNEADEAAAFAFVERAFAAAERGIEVVIRKSEAGIAYLLVHHSNDGAEGYSVVPLAA